MRMNIFILLLSCVVSLALGESAPGVRTFTTSQADMKARWDANPKGDRDWRQLGTKLG